MDLNSASKGKISESTLRQIQAFQAEKKSRSGSGPAAAILLII